MIGHCVANRVRREGYPFLPLVLLPERMILSAESVVTWQELQRAASDLLRLTPPLLPPSDVPSAYSLTLSLIYLFLPMWATTQGRSLSPVVQTWHVRPEELQRTPNSGSPGQFAVECRHRRCLVRVNKLWNSRLRSAVTGHTHGRLMVSTSCFRPHDRNGIFHLRWKWLDFKTRILRRTVKTLTVDSCQTRSYFQVMISNFQLWQKIISNYIKYVYVWCRLLKVAFFDENCGNTSLKMHRFACRANRDSKSETETSYGLVLTPQMQWRPQNFETSLR